MKDAQVNLATPQGYFSPAAGLEFPFVELHRIPVRPFLQPVKVPLSGSMMSYCTKHSCHFCIICKAVEGVLCPILQVSNDCMLVSEFTPEIYHKSLPLAGIHAADPKPLRQTV